MENNNPEPKQLAEQPGQTTPSEVGRRKIMVILGIVIILVVAGSLAGIKIYNHYHHKATLQQQTNKPSVLYSAAKLDTVLLSPKTGEGVSIQKPANFTSVADIQPTDRIMTLRGNQGLANITFESVESTLADNSTAISDFSNYLKSPTAAGTAKYQAYWQNLASGLMKGYQLSYDTPKAFVSNNIKSGAALIGFHGTGPSGLLTPIQGNLIFAIGSHAIYYLVINTTQNNWQPNQSVWTVIDNSLKIDL